MAIQPPYLYSDQRDDSRFPATSFDPKAVTRASWQKPEPKPKRDGPLISFNRHPDAHMVLTHRTNPYAPMGSRTKKAIKWLRRVQLCIRIVQINVALGLLACMVILTNMDAVKGWIMRIVPGIVAGHCLYSIYHLSRDATGRTPGSSAAYQIFSVLADMITMGFYAFTALTIHNDSGKWSTRLSQGTELLGPLVMAAYYGLVGSGSLHGASLFMSLWLAWAFRKISLMPPDMNPLEDNLTARPKHKRNQSSMTTLTNNESEYEKRLSTPGSGRPWSQMSYGEESPRRSVPFMHTRQGSSISFGSGSPTRANLPDRQYQVVPGNMSPRNSAMSPQSSRLSRPVSAQNSAYAELPMQDSSEQDSRVGKFREAWAPTESLVSRTNRRNREAAAAMRQSNRNSAAYAALTDERYDVEDSDSEYGNENDLNDGDLAQGLHPNPLRSNPHEAAQRLADRAKTPFDPVIKHQSADMAVFGRSAKVEEMKHYSADASTLSETSHNRRRVSDKDIADEADPVPAAVRTKRWSQRLMKKRDSSIQPDSAFLAKPYGELKSATPPIIIGNDRKISSGNDYGSKYIGSMHGRRNVSGKVAEEGRATPAKKPVNTGIGFYAHKGY
ncbi:uncharacterized protein F5Z01DRAFT_646293 [Emericellopsis atlantica]|uniref:Uncharacterized protein n=1 Tax=Emericellopsis atlantica TaxID=2614577 RepID=A0A9P8CUE7_9HYPO|nr:uncharacterized protein F5Z01DRAFT_646293 [Emericellopsis atlantica]KAG9257551.1 hypothetical protein F5Z01DRAFT_646293 [Emericellopsis atlantica]